MKIRVDGMELEGDPVDIALVAKRLGFGKRVDENKHVVVAVAKPTKRPVLKEPKKKETPVHYTMSEVERVKVADRAIRIMRSLKKPKSILDVLFSMGYTKDQAYEIYFIVYGRIRKEKGIKLVDATTRRNHMYIGREFFSSHKKEKNVTSRKNPNLSDEERENRRVRTKFLVDKAKGYAKLYKMNWEQAMQRAALDWEANKVKFAKRYALKKINDKMLVEKETEGKRKEAVPLPVVYPLKDDTASMFRDAIMQTVRSERKVLTLNDVRHLENIYGEWSGRIWHEFLIQFLMQSSKICKALDLPGKFVKTIRTGYEVIEYRG